MESILQVRDLTKIFNRKKVENFIAVDHISFDLFKGESLGIVGESGSGKTTVVRMITRLLNATMGEVIFNDEDILKLKGRNLRRIYKDIQMVFQSPYESFNPRYTLGKSVSEPMLNNGINKADAEKRTEMLFSRVGLNKELISRYPHEVSGGQCQRAGIARALGTNPKILICDECTSALDVTIQRQIIDLLNELRSEMDMSYLFISHDLAVVQAFCDRAVVMNKGRIVEEGSVEDIINNPKDEYTKELIECIL